MSPLWRDELRVGLCPDRLVVAHYRAGFTRRIMTREVRSLPAGGAGPIYQLRALAGEAAWRTAPITVVLANHYLRYLILPWAEALSTASDWEGYARLCFTQTYGSPAADWTLRIGAARRGEARLACAVDTDLMDDLRSVPRVSSVQPYLMSAFNARRRRLDAEPSWFVLQEPGRLTLGLVARGSLRTIRNRRVDPAWREALPDMLDRESAGLAVSAPDAANCDRAFIYTEEAFEESVEVKGNAPRRYRLADLTLPPGTSSDHRAIAMVLQ